MIAFLSLSPDFGMRVSITLLHSIWQAAGVAAIAWLVEKLWSKHSLQRSYAVNVIALALILISVPATFMMTASTRNLPIAVGSVVESPPSTLIENSADLVAVPARPLSVGRSLDVHPAIWGHETTEAQRTLESSAKSSSWNVISHRAATLFSCLYAAGVVVMFSRICLGIVRAERLRLRGHAITDGPLFNSLRRVADAWSLQVVPALATVEGIIVPRVVGLLKPTVLIPVSALSGLSLPQLEVLVAHELAHVRRHDLWINLLQRLAEAVLFFNPSLWIVSRRISLLREYCCDDLACNAGEDADDAVRLLYAQALLRVGELARSVTKQHSNLAALAASGHSPSELRRRVARLFGEPLREPLQFSRGALLTLSIIAVLLLAQPGLRLLADNALVPASNAKSEPPTKNPEIESADEQQQKSATISAPLTDADLAVSEARSRTFGFQKVNRIAFKSSYRQTSALEVSKDAKDDLASLWKVRAMEVADSVLDRNRHEALLAWDGDQLLLGSSHSFKPDQTWNQTHYWDGQHGWIGATSGTSDKETKNVYRYSSLEKVMENTAAYSYPHWAAAGGRLFWGGKTVLLQEHGSDPALTHYQLAGSDSIDGVLCDIYDGPERHEKIWIERSTKLVKAVSRHYVTNLSELETSKIVNEAAGRKFANRREQQRWFEALPAQEKDAFSARWCAATWKSNRPGSLSVFSDYREIAPGVTWPHKVDRVVVHAKDNVKDGHKFYLSQLTVEPVPEFSMEMLAKNALPDSGVKVTDRTGEVWFDYVWSDKLDQAEIERLRAIKLADEQAKADKEHQINATPIESVDDALRILLEGPKTDPTIVWARAIRYLVDHSDEALPTLIKTLDDENRDHPISKLAFALRAIGDARAVPALIRALPRTLLPSRSDYGLLLKDEDLLPFMQKHDLDKEFGDTFNYGRAFREVVGALRRITGKKFNEMELNWISLQPAEPQQRIARQQFDRVATRWADWWEANWQQHVTDPAYSTVNLPKVTATDGDPLAGGAIPSGSTTELVSLSSGGIIQSAHDTGKDCFFDLDTQRQAAWPRGLPALGKIKLESPEIRDWARREGFDLLGVTYTPPGEEKPLYCLMPIDLKVWQITEAEHRDLGEMIRGERPYPLSRPVELLVPRRTIPKPWDYQHSGDSFLYVTREGTSGVVRLTAQITEPKANRGYPSFEDHLFEQNAFHRGVKFVHEVISVPSVSKAAASEKRPTQPK